MSGAAGGRFVCSGQSGPLGRAYTISGVVAPLRAPPWSCGRCFSSLETLPPRTRQLRPNASSSSFKYNTRRVTSSYRERRVAGLLCAVTRCVCYTDVSYFRRVVALVNAFLDCSLCHYTTLTRLDSTSTRSFRFPRSGHFRQFILVCTAWPPLVNIAVFSLLLCFH